MEGKFLGRVLVFNWEEIQNQNGKSLKNRLFSSQTPAWEKRLLKRHNYISRENSLTR